MFPHTNFNFCSSHIHRLRPARVSSPLQSQYTPCLCCTIRQSRRHSQALLRSTSHTLRTIGHASYRSSKEQKQHEHQPTTVCSSSSSSSSGAGSRTASQSQTLFPPYTVVQRGELYDLRFYDVYTVAQTVYERRDEGYLALGGYMDGNNAAGVLLAATQPIIMRYEPEGRKQMQLYVGPTRDGSPASSSEWPPMPLDPSVILEAAGGEVAAVLKFEGNATREAAQYYRKMLADALLADGLKLAEEEEAGLFRIAQYGPLNSLSTRVNELLLRVKL